MQELLLIRHAPTATAGHMIGRTDAPARLPDGECSASLAAWVALADLRLCSPAQRCRQTAQWLGGAWQIEDQLWEQDFGAWEGRPYAELPDLGERSRDWLAAHAAPQGESFLELADRVAPVLDLLPAQGRCVIMAHAGVLRAALGLALGEAALGLAFQIEPLHGLRLIGRPQAWAVAGVNLDLTAEGMRL